jgi:predicted nucleic acid-binding protein
VIIVIADTSGLLPALDSTRPDHGAANEAITAAGLLVMSPTPAGRTRSRGNAQAVRVRYGALDLDLADAVNAALAADFDTDAILTLDRRDFRAVRPLGHQKAFRLLPDGLPL